MSSPEPLFGFFNIHKPVGWTSRKAVDFVKRLVRPAKVGHAGTLDPLAEGVLIVCVGQATRLVPSLHELPKSYRGEFLSGRTSDTDDVEGEVCEVDASIPVNRDTLVGVLPQFVGRISQRPPAYSAVKIGGKRAHKLARKGESPDIKPREVDVFRLDLTEFDPPRFVLEVVCGTGTYVRSLGRDVARAAGSDAVMSGLVRTRIGPFGLESALRPDAVTAATIGDQLVPAAAAVSHLTTVTCDASMAAELRHGLPIRSPHGTSLEEGERCAIVSPTGRLIAIGEFCESKSQIEPRQVFH